MLLLKQITTILCMILCFSAVAKKSPNDMKETKIVIIKYDSSLEDCLKNSTANLRRITDWTLYLEGDVNLKLLGEKDEILIPGITKTDITFSHDVFSNVKISMTPIGGWYTLELSIEQVHKLRTIFEKLSQLATNVENFDINKLTLKDLDNKESLIINKYELEHYKIYLILKKYMVPKEIAPRDSDYFQLSVRIDNKANRQFEGIDKVDDFNKPNALDVYKKNYNEAKGYLSLYGDEGVSLNKGVTLSYNHIAEKDPFFIWFAAASLDSNQVGKSIALANNIVLHNCQSTQTVSQGFAYGNQTIHNNIVALYNTYKDLGIEGLKQLHELDVNEAYISQQAYDAFEQYSLIENRASQYAKLINVSASDQKVINHILGNHDNITILKDASMRLVNHEQLIVDSMYTKSFFDNGTTVGETLHDVNWLEKLVANGFKIAGAIILDKYISVDGYDFSSFNDRMSYFSKVFEEYFHILGQKDGFDKLHDQREAIISSLGMEFIAYGEHFNNSVSTDMKLASHTEIPDNLTLVLNMQKTNIGLLFETKEDLMNSPDYQKSYHGSAIFYKNPNLPWLNSYSAFLYTDNKFYYYTLNGINKGLAFPLFQDKGTNLPLGLPLNEQATFVEKNGLEVLINHPELYSDPGHPRNCTALQLYNMHSSIIGTSLASFNMGFNARQDRGFIYDSKACFNTIN